MKKSIKKITIFLLLITGLSACNKTDIPCVGEVVSDANGSITFSGEYLTALNEIDSVDELSEQKKIANNNNCIFIVESSSDKLIFTIGEIEFNYIKGGKL